VQRGHRNADPRSAPSVHISAIDGPTGHAQSLEGEPLSSKISLSLARVSKVIKEPISKDLKQTSADDEARPDLNNQHGATNPTVAQVGRSTGNGVMPFRNAFGADKRGAVQVYVYVGP